MSLSPKYAALLANLSRNTPTQVDPLLFEHSPTEGCDIAFVDTRPPVSAKLWARPEDETSYIGIRVTSPIANQHEIAADLAAAAVERHIIPIFLSWVGQCGMQQFGFRVELIGGANIAETQACEEQLKRLWNLAIIVDVADISSFG